MSNTVNTATSRFNLKKIPLRIKIFVTYWTFAFILFAYLFGIMEKPMRDLKTLNARDYQEYVKIVKEYRANQDRIFHLEKIDQMYDYNDPKIPGIIKKIKSKNLTLNQKRGEIYRKAKYKTWQYRLAYFMGWQFPFNLHKL